MCFALDESLASPPVPLTQLLAMEGLAAVVLKPTILGGLHRYGSTEVEANQS